MLKNTEYSGSVSHLKQEIVVDTVRIISFLTAPGRFLAAKGGKWLYKLSDEK